MSVVAHIVEGNIIASVEVAVPPDVVFRAISSDEICAWWGSDDTYRVVAWDGDVRPGGRWQATTRAADGSREMIVRGEFVTVDPPRLLVHSWEPSWEGYTKTMVRYELTPIANGTRVEVIHYGFTDAAAQRDHAEGWKRVLAWLAEHF